MTSSFFKRPTRFAQLQKTEVILMLKNKIHCMLLQVKIPVAMMSHHSLPTPPPSVDLPATAQQQHQQQQQHLNKLAHSHEHSTLSQKDVVTYHLMANMAMTSAHMAMVAQTSSHRAGIATDGGRMETQQRQDFQTIAAHHHHQNHLLQQQHQHPSQTMPREYVAGNYENQQHQQQLLHGYYGNRSSATTARNSTSTPSPSQQSVSPPPRCDSGDSSHSTMSGDSSPASAIQYHGFPTASYEELASHHHHGDAASEGSSPVRYSAHVVSMENPSREMHLEKSRKFCYDDEKERFKTCAVDAIDLSRPNGRYHEDPHSEQELDDNHNVILQPQEAGKVINAESMWRPW